MNQLPLPSDDVGRYGRHLREAVDRQRALPRRDQRGAAKSCALCKRTLPADAPAYCAECWAKGGD